MTLYAYAMLALLAPGQDTHELGEAIDAAAETPLEAALLVATAWRETRFGKELSGDHGRSAGPFGHWCAPDVVMCERLKMDWFYAARIAHEDIATSLSACKEWPAPERLTWYLSGKCGVAPKQSADRWHLARWLLRHAT